MPPIPPLSDVRLPMFWRWALTVLFAAAVMVGLLGMHTLSSGHAELPAAMTAASEGGHEHSTATEAAVTDAQPDAGSGCVECGSPSHDALMMVCLLGLLVTLLLVASPATGLLRARQPAVAARAIAALVTRIPPGPSLLELSISRT